MSDLFRKLANIGSSSNGRTRPIHNASQRTTEKIEENMTNWSIAKHDIKTVDKIRLLNFNKDM